MTGTEDRLGTKGTRLVWAAAIIVAAIGAWLMFDAMPGINWGIWTACASVGLVILMRARDTLNSSALLMLGPRHSRRRSVHHPNPRLCAELSRRVLFLAMGMLFLIDPGSSA